MPVPDVRSRAYLIVGEGGAVLVDSGMPRNAGNVLRCLTREGVRRESLVALMLTHWHIDHAGSAARVKDKAGTATYVHEADRPRVEGHALPALPNVETRRGRFAQWLLRKLYRRCPIDHAVRGGDVLPLAGGLRVIHVPGHTAGHVCYFHEPSGSLFLGDALMARGDAWILPQQAFSEDPEEARRSLARLRDLPVTSCYFGHGEPVTEDAAARLRRAIDHLLEAGPLQGPEGSTAAPVLKRPRS